MSNKDLIYIGKRSKLLNSLYPLLPKGEIISFKNAFKSHLKNKFKNKINFIFPTREM